MAIGAPAESDGLLRETMAVLRRAYEMGRADALREAATMLAAAAPPTAAPAREQEAELTLRRRGLLMRGRKRGRPDSLTEDRREAVAALLAEGRLSRREIAEEVGVSPTRLCRWLKESGTVGDGAGRASPAAHPVP